VPTAKDLRAEPPRRWSDELEGVLWLPRLIDKARAARAGTLGNYLYGQSPEDRALLHKLDMGHREFFAIVDAAPDDAAVARIVRERDPEAFSAAARWSRRFFHAQWPLMVAFDIDDGYVRTPLAAIVQPLANGISGLVKRLWPVEWNR